MNNDINPYQSPAEVFPAASPRTASELVSAPNLNDYRSGHTRAVVAMTVLVAIAIVAILRIGSTAYQINLLNRIQSRGGFSIEEAKVSDAIQVGISFLWVGLWIVSSITFMTWSYRAYQNLRPLGNRGLEYSPGWTIGAWFIPILNLFYPYRIHAEIWRGSDPAAVRDNFGLRGKASSLVGWWWGSYLLMNIVHQLGGPLSADKSAASLVTSCGALIAGDCLAVPAAILAVSLIRGIDRNQTERYELLLQQPTAAPQELPNPADWT
jgi:hypothetical protein